MGLKNDSSRDERLAKIIIAPIVSEKSTDIMENRRTASFRVRVDATRREIKDATEKMFEVKVDAVRVLNVHGKPAGRGMITGRRRNWKKAYVRLGEGQDISFGEAG